MENDVIIYDAAAYYRLSKDDFDIDRTQEKHRSDSITNQQSLIRDFVKSHPDIRLAAERIDDGYSGTNFNRPAFMELLEDVKSGRINCIIVKDLSRLGREYIETGRYIQRMFPALGIRFIAINDYYDSLDTENQSSQFYLPFKNLVNDSYSRDTSIKIRSHLQIKCKQGEFIGAFAVYGYKKDQQNKNKIVPDEYAAGIVRNIFEWKLEGLSQQRIANRLNESGELSPLEYKKAMGINYQSSFKKNSRALWSAVTVGRILKNEIYTGVLLQGKRSTPNHKVKNTIYRKESEWIRAEGTHEPIISKATFQMVQGLLEKDLRVAQNRETVYPFSGLLVCGDCGEALIRKATVANGKEYAYYICSTNRLNGTCSSHRISEAFLYKMVLDLLNKHIEAVVSLQDFCKSICFSEEHKKKILAADTRLNRLNEELKKYKHLKMSVYEDYAEKVIGREEYEQYGKTYKENIEKTIKNIGTVKKELIMMMAGDGSGMEWTKLFIANKKLPKLDRKLLVMLIDRCVIYENKKMIFVPKYKDEFDQMCDMLKRQVTDNAAKAVM